jgi:anaerobic sulfite reductase subunit A
MTNEPILLEKSMAAKGKSLLYRILASLYLKEATAETLRILSTKEVVETLDGLGVDTGKLCTPAEDNEGQKRFLDELVEEYTALFILPGGVSPYESVRLKGLLCQDPEWKVREFYKRFGVVMREGSSIFSDHMGMELDFLSYLADKEAAAWGANDEEGARGWLEGRREFFDEHMSKWVNGFTDELDRCAFHPFYREVSALTRKLMEIEGAELLTERPQDGPAVEPSPA